MMKREYYLDDDMTVPNREMMLSYLLENDIVFMNTRPYVCLDGKVHPETIVIFVNCNDICAPASDAVEITESELPVLFESVYESKSTFGQIKWICKKINCQPMKWIRENLKANNEWDDEMESLPANKI